MHIEEGHYFRRDIRFFWQAFLTNVNFLFILFNFNVTRRLAKTRFEGFLAVTFIWELGHLIDGFILVVSNGELRQRFLHPKRWISTGTELVKVVTVEGNTLKIGPSIFH